MSEIRRYTCAQCGDTFRFGGRVADSIHADSQSPYLVHYCAPCARERHARQRDAARRADLDRREERQRIERQQARNDSRRERAAQQERRQEERERAEEAEEQEREHARGENERTGLRGRLDSRLAEVARALDTAQASLALGNAVSAWNALQGLRSQWPTIAAEGSVTNYDLADLAERLDELDVRFLNVQLQCARIIGPDTWSHAIEAARKTMSRYVAGTATAREQGQLLLETVSRLAPDEYQHFDRARSVALRERQQNFAQQLKRGLMLRLTITWSTFFWIPLTLWCAARLRVPLTWTSTEQFLSLVPGTNIMVFYDQWHRVSATHHMSLFLCAVLMWAIPAGVALAAMTRRSSRDPQAFIAAFDDRGSVTSGSGRWTLVLFGFMLIPMSSIGAWLILLDLPLSKMAPGWFLLSWIPVFNIQVVWNDLWAGVNHGPQRAGYVCVAIGLTMLRACIGSWQVALLDKKRS